MSERMTDADLAAAKATRDKIGWDGWDTTEDRRDLIRWYDRLEAEVRRLRATYEHSK